MQWGHIIPGHLLPAEVSGTSPTPPVGWGQWLRRGHRNSGLGRKGNSLEMLGMHVLESNGSRLVDRSGKRRFGEVGGTKVIGRMGCGK